MAKTVNMTFRIPADLRKRMKDIDENWTRIVIDAFEDRIAQAAKTREIHNMKDAIERLRACDREEASESFKQGLEHGESWAQVRATPKDLRRLARCREHVGAGFQFGIGSSAYSAGEQFFFAIAPELDGQRGDALEFWDNMSNSREQAEDTMCDPDYINGFTQGAVEFWESVEEQV